MSETDAQPEQSSEGLLQSILNRQASSAQPEVAEVAAGDCYNCHVHGSQATLKDGVCPTCGFVAPNPNLSAYPYSEEN